MRQSVLSGMVAVFLVMFAQTAAGAEKPDADPLKKDWKTTLTFAQTNFDNWARGGTNTLNMSWFNDARLVYRRDHSVLRYSAFYTLDYARTNGNDIRKTDDRFEFESIYSFDLPLFTDPYAAVTVKTQLLPGYDYESPAEPQNSGFFDPGYATQSVGFNYAIEDYVVTRVGFSVKETFARDYTRELLDDTTKTYQVEPGIELVSDFSHTFREWLDLKSKVEVFSDLQTLKTTDVHWRNLVGFQWNSWLTLQMQLTLFYDSDFSEKRQLKETVTFGLHYTFW